jgi:hypothetical protein
MVLLGWRCLPLYFCAIRPDKIWSEPIFWPELEGKIWVWIGVFWPGNKDDANPYLTHKMAGRVGSTRGSHGSTRFSKDFFFFFSSVFCSFFFFLAFWVYIIMLGIEILWVFCFLNDLKFDYYKSSHNTN